MSFIYTEFEIQNVFPISSNFLFEEHNPPVLEQQK